MNKLMLLTVASAFLISTAGMAAPKSGTQAGHSPVYQLDVTYDGNVVGKVTVNTSNEQLPDYLLVARGLTPNTEYTFGYTASGEVYTIGSTTTPKAGALVLNGTFPLDDVEELESAEFWVTETPPGIDWSKVIYGFHLDNDGLYIARLACDYSTDGGVTWQESDHTGPMFLFMSWDVPCEWLNVPNDALVRIHVKIEGGKDKIGGEVWQYHYPCDWIGYQNYPQYYVDGTTFKHDLVYYGVYQDWPY